MGNFSIPYIGEATLIKYGITTIDKLLEVRILGGETFLYPKIEGLIEYLHNNNKIEKIVLFTNSTIIPNEKIIKSLQKSKIEVHMSNYGEISTKKDYVQKLFDSRKISYYVHDYLQWRDMGDVKIRGYSETKKIRIYRSCDNKNCPTFYRGKLYVCPRAAHGEQLGFFTNKAEEIIDFNNINQSVSEYKEKIKKWQARELFEACNYCNGNNIYNKTIPAAIQIIRR